MLHIVPNTWFFSSKNCWEQTVLLCSQPVHSWAQTFFNSVFEIFLEPPFETFEVKGGSSKGHITSLEVITESLDILWTMGGRLFITLCICILNGLVIYSTLCCQAYVVVIRYCLKTIAIFVFLQTSLYFSFSNIILSKWKAERNTAKAKKGHFMVKVLPQKTRNWGLAPGTTTGFSGIPGWAFPP